MRTRQFVMVILTLIRKKVSRSLDHRGRFQVLAQAPAWPVGRPVSLGLNHQALTTVTKRPHLSKEAAPAFISSEDPAHGSWAPAGADLGAGNLSPFPQLTAAPHGLCRAADRTQTTLLGAGASVTADRASAAHP